MSLHLDAFIEHELKMLARFTEFWKRKHLEDPEMYPMSFPEGDEGGWDEQFRAFCETYQEDNPA